MWPIAIILTGIVLILCGLYIYSIWSRDPAVYHGVAFEDLQRFFSSWVEHVAERQDIMVGTPREPYLIQFRKRHYKTRPDLLLFRFRNGGQSKQYFSKVVTTFERNEIAFNMELTPRRRAPRAMMVELDASDPMLPSAAVYLCRVTFSAIGHLERTGVSVFCTGLGREFNPGGHNIIPTTRGWRAGWRFGYVVGNSIRTLRNRLGL
jgi:hypothetical protein